MKEKRMCNNCRSTGRECEKYPDCGIDPYVDNTMCVEICQSACDKCGGMGEVDLFTPDGKLTVIIRDDAPFIFCNDTPAYRTVVIQLTDEQRRKIELRETGQSGNTKHYEAVSSVILE